MRQGVDTEFSVVQQHGAPEEADRKPRLSANEGAERSEHDPGQAIPFMQQHQLGIRTKVGNPHRRARRLEPANELLVLCSYALLRVLCVIFDSGYADRSVDLANR